MDFITSLPTSKGFDSILSTVDHELTKGIILVLCKKTITADELASILLTHLYRWFGLPDKMISDWGLQFVVCSFQALLNKLGIKLSLSTTFHPQSDRTTKRYNQEIKTYLSIYYTAHPHSWVDHLPFLEFAHNSRRHSDQQTTLFELIYGTAPKPIPTVTTISNLPAVKLRLEFLDKIWQEATAAHELAAK